jgi:hypothetical protein
VRIVALPHTLAPETAIDCAARSIAAFSATFSGSGQAVDDFETRAGGRRMATSVGGALTGRGADLIIVRRSAKGR